jgi:GDP-4-dehydro-6-deoxy-D-mannose reductase
MPDATLITGAAGFAGSHLLELIVGSGGSGEIIAWHRPGREVLPTPDARVRWEAVDVLDRAAVRRSIERDTPAAVYHCAGAAHVGRAWDSTDATFAVNVRGTHFLLEALERASVEATVFIPSSALVYTPADRPLTEHDPLMPSSPYGLSKLAQEMLAHHAGGGVTVTVARAFNHVGARQDPHFAASGFARRIADIEKGRWEPAISVGNLDARRDFTDVRDTVRAYRLILEHGAAGEAFNVCSGRALAVGELLDRLIARARVPVSIKVDPARYRPNDVPLLLGDPSKIREHLGWAPVIPIERTLDDLLEYWRRQE